MMRTVDENPFRLDSPRPRIPLKAYAYNELRYSSLAATHPEAADALLVQAQAAVNEKYRQYEELASRDGSRFHPDIQPEPQEAVLPKPATEVRRELPVLAAGQ
jgi:pyruvate-ferredoxin/flavodoxin oxidoreductase